MNCNVRKQLTTRGLALPLTLVFFLTACGAPGPTVTPSSAPTTPDFVATGVSLTQTASAQSSPTHTESPTFTPSPSATATPEIPTPLVSPPLLTLDPTTIAELPPTPLPNPDIPDAPIRILRPGNLSRVISPFKFVLDVPPGPDGKVQVDLLGEDGRLLARKVFTLATPPGSDRNIAVLDFDFEIRPGIVAEAGRIEVIVLDVFGRIQYMASHDLILLSTGRAEIRFPVTQSERLYIEQPANLDSVSGGTLLISGRIRDLGDQPLVIELIAEDGRIIATGLAAVQPAPTGEHGIFVGELVYSVDEPTPVRLTIRARGARIPGNSYISTLLVLLNP